MVKRKEIKFQDRHGALRGRQNGMEFWIRKDELQTKGGKQRYFVTVYPASNNPQQISTRGRQDFDLGGAMELCQKIAAGEIAPEDMLADFAAEDMTREQVAVQEIRKGSRPLRRPADPPLGRRTAPPAFPAGWF